MSGAPSRDSSPAPRWSDADTEIIRKAAAEGYSARQAAKMLPGNRSRNSVIGRAFRLGIQFQGKVVLSPLQVVKRKKQCQANAKARTKPQPKSTWRPPVDFRRPGGPIVIAPAPQMVEPDLSNARPWTSRRFGQCAYPVSGEGADTHSCCAPTGSVYCEAHHGLVYIVGTAGKFDSRVKRPDFTTSPEPLERVRDLVEMVA